MAKINRLLQRHEKLCNWLVWLLAVALPGGLILMSALFILTGSTKVRPPIWPRNFTFRPVISYF